MADEKDHRVRVGMRELRANLSGFLLQARHGASFLVMSHDEAMAEIRPPSVPERRRRPIGLLRGKIRLAPDFDETPAELIAAMEGEREPWGSSSTRTRCSGSWWSTMRSGRWRAT